MLPVNSILLAFLGIGLLIFVPTAYSLIFLSTLILYWNYRTKKSFLNWFYIFFFVLSFSLPALIRLLGQFGREYTVYADLNLVTGLYIFCYIFLLVFTKKIIENSMPSNSGAMLNHFFKLFDSNELRRYANFYLIIAYLLFFMVIYYLDSVGWYRSGDFALERQASSKPPQQIALLAEFGPVLLIISCMLWRQTKQNLTFLIYVVGFVILLFLALISGSRWLVISTGIVLFYNHAYFRKYTLLLFTIGIPFIGILFPTLLIYRSASGLTLYGAMQEVLTTDFEAVGALLEVISGRINMLSTTNLMVSDFAGSGGGSNYLGNLTGLIPRVLWPEKPVQLNSNDLGAELGLISSGDILTSVSLSVIGESFYELAFLGLTVAIFQGLFFALIDKMDRNGTVSSVLYFLLSIKVVTLGTLYIFVPEIINFFIVGWIVLTGTALMIYKTKNNERSTSSY